LIVFDNIDRQKTEYTTNRDYQSIKTNKK